MLSRLMVAVAATAVIAYAVVLVLGSGIFPPPGERGALPHDVIALVAITLGVSLLHVGACVVARRQPPRLLYVLLVGVAARLILLFGAPGAVLEGDRARIRFEGRMINRGLNPYEFKPSELSHIDPDDALLGDEQLRRIQKARAITSASDDGPRPEAVLRPDLRTASTPLGLWIASIADRFTPESTRGYAFLALCADVLAGFLLLVALRSMGLPLGWLIVYAWCPVLLKEVYCSFSTDIFVMPAMAGLVCCVVSAQRVLGAVPLALCIALRPAMLVLLPLMGRKVGLLGVVLALLLAVLPFLPFYSHHVPTQNYVEGQVHLWRHYEYNSALENTLRGVLRHVPWRAENSLTIADVEIIQPDERLDVLLAKVAGLIVLLSVVTYSVIRLRPDPDMAEAYSHALLTDLFVVLAALLIVSPVLRPSLALWLFPILVVRPMGISWLVLPGLLSLSYLTHIVGPQAADLTFAGGKLSFRVVEFGAFLALLLVDLLRPRAGEAVERREPGLVVPEEELATEHLEYEQDPALVG